MDKCIEHTHFCDKDGYGRVYLGNKKYLGLHRLVYCQMNDVPLSSIKGKVVRHSCDNPKCINPDHLSVGTHLDNMADKVKRNRQHRPTGMSNGRCKLTDLQVAELRSAALLLTHNELAKAFGISRSQVQRILYNKQRK